MKYIIVAFIVILCSCTHKDWCQEIMGHNHAMPDDDYWRKVTGYDSVQIYPTDNGIKINFCYSNKWEFEKFKKPDTIFIHDTIYTSKHYGNVQTLNIGGND